MSVVFIVVPAVAASWPVLCGAAAAAAGALGYRALDSARAAEHVSAPTNGVEVTLAGSEVLGEAMKRDSEFVLVNGDIRATFRRAADGRCTVHVSGDGHTQEELNAMGQELLGRVTQQYAYNKVLSELKQQGFSVTSEDVAKDRTIRVRVSRFS